jgi:hypothetical protein|tara:strand:- start:2129 stop:2338 length:210 start_codon:yes stop_codon:yes gene_type:complete
MPKVKPTLLERAAAGECSLADYDRIGDTCIDCAYWYEVRGTACDEHLGYKYETYVEMICRQCGINMGGD